MIWFSQHHPACNNQFASMALNLPIRLHVPQTAAVFNKFETPRAVTCVEYTINGPPLATPSLRRPHCTSRPRRPSPPVARCNKMNRVACIAFLLDRAGDLWGLKRLDLRHRSH